ncbi:MAG: hypothetical protein J5I90_22030 [Caldilineales bacterium]|nr:hypothetical protein [Caldilineales bacterium]
MTFELVNVNGDEVGYTRFSRLQWMYILDLACEYGWVPKGTAPPEKWDTNDPQRDSPLPPWEGTYFSNDRQIVTEDDALALAEALNKAIAPMPDSDKKEALMELIDLCRIGAFRIY